MNLEKNEMVKKGLTVFVLILIALISIFGVSEKASSPETYKNSIKALDDKKLTVIGLTAATAGTATALSTIPGDVTTPIANQIMQLSSYLLIVTGAIFLEKMLLTLTGYVAFKFLIPIACLLAAMYFITKKDVLKTIAIKLSVFGAIIVFIVPLSINVSLVIENTFQSSINGPIEVANNIESGLNNYEKEETTTQEKGLWDTIKDKTQEITSNIGNKVTSIIENAKNALNKFIDAIAVLIITTCIIPIAVLLLLVWVVKIIFNFNIIEKGSQAVNELKKMKKDK